MEEKKIRSSNLELLRILCILFIIGDHFTGQSGIAEYGSFINDFFYCAVTSLSRVGCSVFIIISAWFSIGKEFKFRKILHVWLTVIMYTVPLVLFMCVKGLAGRADLIKCFFPIEESPLWFAGYYIVLVLFMPFLNMLITKAPRKMLELLLVLVFCMSCLYTTITNNLGIFDSDVWTMIFLYCLTGYIRHYGIKIPSIGKAFSVFFGVWLLVTLGRVFSSLYDLGQLSVYCETFRARMQSLPNLLMAYSLFFGFLGINLKSSKTINKIASASLGVYCFHQVPVWYQYLWSAVFRADFHAGILHGGKRMLYTLCGILGVFILGTVIEFVRAKVSGVLIEDRNYCRRFCLSVDNIVNGDGKISTLKPVIAVLAVYFIVLQVFSFGNGLSTASGITSKIDITLECQDFSYSNGDVTGVIEVTNNGRTILDVSSGKYPVNIGVSLLDQDGNVINSDLVHIAISNGDLKSGETVDVPVEIQEVPQVETENCVLRFEIVQDGIDWVETTAVYWDF